MVRWSIYIYIYLMGTRHVSGVHDYHTLYECKIFNPDAYSSEVDTKRIREVFKYLQPQKI